MYFKIELVGFFPIEAEPLKLPNHGYSAQTVRLVLFGESVRFFVN